MQDLHSQCIHRDHHQKPPVHVQQHLQRRCLWRVRLILLSTHVIIYSSLYCMTWVDYDECKGQKADHLVPNVLCRKCSHEVSWYLIFCTPSDNRQSLFVFIDTGGSNGCCCHWWTCQEAWAMRKVRDQLDEDFKEPEIIVIVSYQIYTVKYIQ